jgi:hypothetical protein
MHARDLIIVAIALLMIAFIAITGLSYWGGEQVEDVQQAEEVE